MQRAASLERWIASHFPNREFSLSPASVDASFRRYFRVRFDDGKTVIAMDAPPQHEDCRPFVKVAQLMLQAGVHVPKVIAQRLEEGFLLLSDLGTVTYLVALNDANAPSLFNDAVRALLLWQLASRPDTLPAYDEALLRRELELFPQWYIGRHLGVVLSASQKETLEACFTLIIRSNLAQPKVYVHRDYMPRNLMVTEPNPGVLDFQDAVYGPISYDVVSLFKDAFLSWKEEQVLDWTIRYWERARAARLPVRHDFAEFYRDFEWMGLQRHLKVLGIFARICYRDAKSGYLEDTPRFVRYVREVGERYSALLPLVRLLDELDRRIPGGERAL
ncbi:MAG: aminoglycoside phosphotransferase family protein [Burkholderiales bacterium]